jgi:hypothetical protein
MAPFLALAFLAVSIGASPLEKEAFQGLVFSTGVSEVGVTDAGNGLTTRELIAKLGGLTSLEERFRTTEASLGRVTDLSLSNLDAIRGTFSTFYNRTSQIWLQELSRENILKTQALLRETESYERQVSSLGASHLLSRWEREGVSQADLREYMEFANGNLGIDTAHSVALEFLYKTTDLDAVGLAAILRTYPILIHNQKRGDAAESIRRHNQIEAEGKQLIHLLAKDSYTGDELVEVLSKLEPQNLRILLGVIPRLLPRSTSPLSLTHCRDILRLLSPPSYLLFGETYQQHLAAQMRVLELLNRGKVLILLQRQSSRSQEDVPLSKVIKEFLQAESLERYQ